MNGLRFYPEHAHARPDPSRSGFDYIFRPIYTKLASSLYAEERPQDTCLHGGCGCRILDLYTRSAIATLPRWDIMSGQLLDQFGKYVRDDWNSLLFFRGASDHRTVCNTTNHMSRGREVAFPECSDARTLLHNWDGIYWEVFSKERDILSVLRTAHAGDSHLEMYWVDYELDFPNPRDTPLQPAESADQ